MIHTTQLKRSYSTSGSCDAAGVKKLLVVSHTEGFRHTEGIEAGEPVLVQLSAKTGQFSVDFCRNAEEVKQMLVPEYLKPYDGVIFLNTTGNLGIPDLDAFLSWIKDGHAFIGIHAAADTYRADPETAGYIEMIGGEFRGHNSQCTVTPDLDDPQHPSVTPLGEDFSILDEIYLYKNNDRNKLHALLSVNKGPDDGSDEAGKPGDYLLAWNKMYGSGSVFYTAFGHRQDVWENQKFQGHLLGGILWALGIVPGSAELPK